MRSTLKLIYGIDIVKDCKALVNERPQSLMIRIGKELPAILCN